MFEPMFLVYMLILYLGIVMAKKNKTTVISLVLSFVVLNMMNMDLIRDNYSTQFVFIFIYELVNIFVSFVVLNLLYNFSKMKSGGLLTITELLISLGLVYLYAYTSNVMLSFF